MIKRIMATMVVMTALYVPAALAVDVAVEGTYVIDGDYYDTGDVDYGYYSHELDIAVTFKADDSTWMKTSFGIVDRTWGDDPNTTYTSDITLDRVWLTHVFACGTRAEAGLMDGGAWGTMLGDADDGYLRLRVTKDYSFGTLSAYVQKNNEIGASDTTVVDGEDDDSDEYSVEMTVKAGDLVLMPKLAYADDSAAVADQGEDGTQTILAAMAAAGEFGALGFEAELNYWNVSTDVPGDSDYDTVNLYADVWMTKDALKAGLAVAYGSEDDGNFTDFGTDFCPMVLMDNDDGDIAGLGAMALVKVYGDYAVNDKLGLGAALAYADVSEDAWGTDDTGILEINLTGSYQLTDALSYSIALAYGDVDAWDDPIMYMGHEIVFSF